MKLTSCNKLWPNSGLIFLRMTWKTRKMEWCLMMITKTGNFKIWKCVILMVTLASNLTLKHMKVRGTNRVSPIWEPSWEKIGQLNRWKRTKSKVWMSSWSFVKQQLSPFNDSKHQLKFGGSSRYFTCKQRYRISKYIPCIENHVIITRITI